MAHWSEAYVGQPYVAGEHDCAVLAARVAREVFGRAVVLPEERDASRLGRVRQIAAGAGELAAPVETPAEGDAVLMICAGRPSHVGVFCRIGGHDYVLHAMKNAGMVVLHRLRDLDKQGLSVEGFYRWK